MKFNVLKKLPQTFFNSQQRWISLFGGSAVDHLACLQTLPVSTQVYQHQNLSTGSTLSPLPQQTMTWILQPAKTWRQISTMDMRSVFRNNDDDDDNDQDNDHSKTGRRKHKSDNILGSKCLTEFKDQCMDMEFRMTPKDWGELEKQVISESPWAERAWEATCLRLISAAQNMDLAESFMSYIRSKGRPPKIAVLATFIAMCGKCCGKLKQELIFEAYNEMLEITDLFDSITTKNLVQGFSHTDRWRECMKFIEMTKLADSPTTTFYSPVVSAALREGDIDMAFSLLDLMGEEGMRPKESVFQEFVKNMKDCQSGVTLDGFMDYLRKYHWLISEDTAMLLEEYFIGSEKRRYKISFTQVNRGGVCQTCRHRLKRLELSNAEFEVLQREMLENVLIGDNVYLHSSPEEVERFKDFVQENAPFDVVLDALNVAYRSITENTIRKPSSLFLKRVVEYFAHFQHQRVLVIGRQHMRTWSQRDMHYIERLAKTFYTDDSSKDDPFSLYAALYSGKSCLIVSQDHMKDHKFKLGSHMKEAFEQWQRSHQITSCYMRERGKMYVEMPMKHENGPQEDVKGWHIPYEDQCDRPVYQRPNTWLCVRDVGGKRILRMSNLC